MIGGFFGHVCAMCTSVCCTPDICEESLDSAFLNRVRSVCGEKSLFCDRFGWLTERGCALACGRPPVCYGFFCNEILDALDSGCREDVRKLGRIISGVGERALGSRHLVELDEDDLRRLDWERLGRKIAAGRKMLDEIKISCLP